MVRCYYFDCTLKKTNTSLYLSKRIKNGLARDKKKPIVGEETPLLDVFH